MDEEDKNLIIPVSPLAKPRMTQRDRWKKRKCVEDYWHYRDQLRPVVTILEPLQAISLVFHIPMPASWSKKKRQVMDQTPHRSRPDLDNYIKGFCDVFEEDKEIHYIEAQKLWAIEGGITIYNYNHVKEGGVWKIKQ
jgi:Holliday junction resolvase RusA-like endonuclease